MTQVLFSVGERFQRGILFLRRAGKRELHVGAAKIRRKMHVGDSGITDARIRHFVADKLVEFFANTSRDALAAMGIHASG